MQMSDQKGHVDTTEHIRFQLDIASLVYLFHVNTSGDTYKDLIHQPHRAITHSSLIELARPPQRLVCYRVNQPRTMESGQNLKGTDTPTAIPTSQSVVGAKNQDALGERSCSFD